MGSEMCIRDRPKALPPWLVSQPDAGAPAATPVASSPSKQSKDSGGDGGATTLTMSVKLWLALGIGLGGVIGALMRPREAFAAVLFPSPSLTWTSAQYIASECRRIPTRAPRPA